MDGEGPIRDCPVSACSWESHLCSQAMHQGHCFVNYSPMSNKGEICVWSFLCSV